MLFIPINKLKSGMELADEILIFERSNVRLLDGGTVLTQQFIDRLRRFDVSGIFVRDGITGDVMPSVPLMDKKTKAKSLNNLEWVFQHSTNSSDTVNQKYIEHLDKTVLQLVELVREDPSKLVNISDLKAYDEYTYHHSLSVAVISLAIGVQMNLSKDEMHKLGFAAMMHDIGKMNIPVEIINKPDRLTREEFEMVKTHPKLGEAYLLKNGIDDPDIYEGVVFHHEKLDGTGYPEGLTERKIPFFSKIISVADVYDALTSQRPYREPLLNSLVAEYIMGNCGTAFDIDIIRAFLKKIEFFPLGSFVELSDGRKAVVVDNEHALHPTVTLIEPPYETLDLFNDSSTYNTVIKTAYEAFPGGSLPMM